MTTIHCEECGARFSPGNWPCSSTICKRCFKVLEPDWYMEYIRYQIETLKRESYD